MHRPAIRRHPTRRARRPSPLAAESLESRQMMTAGVLVSPLGGPLLEGSVRAFAFRLQDAPAGTVTIGVASSDTTEGTIDRTALVFTPQNWNVAQKVTVRGVQDFTRDGTQTFSIVTGDTVSDDPRYHGRVVRDITLASIDSGRTAAFAVWPSAALVTRESDAETGRSTGFWMALTAQPAADVTVPLSSSDPNEGLPAVASLAFTPGNWRVPQRVGVAGIDDGIPDGKVAYRIVTGPAESDDPWFAGKDARDVNAVNLPWYYAGLFDGIYTGTFVGRQVSGTIDRVEISGTSIRVDITVHGQQWESFSGTGTISSTGAFSVRTTAAGSVGGATFFGTIFADPLTRLVVGKGGWNFRNLYTGTWDVAQQPPVS